MGIVTSCIKKESNHEFDLVLEKTVKSPVLGNKEDKDDLEQEFDSLYENLNIPNESVAAKWKQLQKFSYDNRKELALLQIIKGDTQIPGEAYYGFWYA